MKNTIISYKNKLLARKVKVCDTIFSRTLGLMFHSKLNSGEALLLLANKESIAQTSIHTFFVFFPIDVLWINEKKEIVDKKTVFPFHPLLSPKAPAKYVLEMGFGQLEKVKIGETISF
ncbi:MAG: DUF192 domain-containing protein [bacterium]|nr:DUF192 domain-containing protein [bacterium]